MSGSSAASGAGDVLVPDGAGPQVVVPVVEPAKVASTGKVSANGHLPVLAKVAETLQNKALDEGVALQPNQGDDDESDAQEAPEADRGRRIEVTNTGTFWQWRWSDNGTRKSKYGGKFKNLSEARQRAYRRNKRSKSRNQRTRHKEK